jgi:hypothetical protein
MSVLEPHIEALRKLMKPSEVQQGCIPGWLNRRCRAYLKTQRPAVMHLGCQVQAAMERVKFLTELNSGVLDHYGTTSKKGEYYSQDWEEPLFVMEPYHFRQNDALFVEAFCKAVGVEWHVSAKSWHFPGETIRIVIHT